MLLSAAYFMSCPQVPHAMLAGWQHCWLAISAHPSLAALQPGPMHPWLAAAVALVPWNLVLTAAASAGAVLWINRGRLQAEKTALRYELVLLHIVYCLTLDRALQPALRYELVLHHVVYCPTLDRTLQPTIAS